VPQSPPELPLAEAVALGLLHGPAELVPVSSSGHVAAVPELLRWRTARASGAARKELEVALHTGTALAMLLGLRGELLMRPTPRRLALLACSFAPPALVGGLFEHWIEDRVRGPRWLAGGLAAGALALLLADGAPQERGREEAGWVDGLWLGVAQAAALVPGASRNGMTLAAARARRFRRPDASELSWRVALPVLVGATALKGSRVAARLRRDPGLSGPAGAAPTAAGAGTAVDDSAGVGLTAGGAGTARDDSAGVAPTAAGAGTTPDDSAGLAPLAAGAAAAFASTLASMRWIGLRRERPLWPWAVERAALAAAVFAAARSDREE
jgi:undecaprenyl-diphosphatase